jgi:hypothetical protein
MMAGSGPGLYIVKEAIEKLHAKINSENRNRNYGKNENPGNCLNKLCR